MEIEYKIMMAEGVPTLNKGEMTILEGMIESFKVVGRCQVSMLSIAPEIDRIRSPSEVSVIDLNEVFPFNKIEKNPFLALVASIYIIFLHICFALLYNIIGLRALRLMRSEIWKRYADSDVIIVGHDGAFGYGGGVGAPIILYPLFIPIFSKLIRKKTTLYGGSISNELIRGRIATLLLKFVLRRFDLITLRERTSLGNLQRIGFIHPKIFVTADPAFLLASTSPERIEEIMRLEELDRLSGPTIGITITREKASVSFRNLEPQESYSRHIELIGEMIDSMIDRINATFVFVPHCIGKEMKKDDRLVARDILLKCRNRGKIRVITNEYEAGELKGLMTHFDFFIAERIHSAINALSMETPTIIIGKENDERLDIIRMMGQGDQIIYLENLTSKGLIEKINKIWSRRSMIREELKLQTELMRKLALQNGNLLREILIRND